MPIAILLFLDYVELYLLIFTTKELVGYFLNEP